jgi:cytochrome b pre-mRNA-processing protein 3
LKNSGEPAQQPSWLTRQIESSPAAKNAFLGIAKVLGYGSPKQLAARRAFVLYEKIAAMKPDEDKAFWLNGELNFTICETLYRANMLE